ncbi:MAG: amidohydrolase [Saprospiraceae bacterium]
MKNLLLALLPICLFPSVLKSQNPALSPVKKEMSQKIDARFAEYKDIAAKIWDYAETGFKEEKSTAVLQKRLREAGFKVETGVAEMPTAFVASFGSGKPVIGILAEFDALPGITQTDSPERTPDPKKDAGHACGHHLFGVASTAAGISLKEMLENEKISGTVRVYGTPAEEGGNGKAYMVRAGLFDDVDVVLHWHPGNSNVANAASSLANVSIKFRFHGISAHAAGAPEQGRSALDGVESMNYMVNMLREHVTQETRIHYIITKGGRAPNVVPDFSEVHYLIRHPKRHEVKNLVDRVVKAAEGAALGTGTTMDYEIMGGAFELLPVEILSKLVHRNLESVGGVEYTAAEVAFAEKIQKTLIGETPPDIASAKTVKPFEVEALRKGSGSTDVGDVSWVVPTVGFRTATWVPGTPAHSWQAVACGGTDIGFKGMMVAAKTLALSGYDLFHDAKTIQLAREEWEKLLGKDFKYEALFGDRKPPLDYRD